MVTTTKNAVKECVVIVLYQLRNGRPLGLIEACSNSATQHSLDPTYSSSLPISTQSFGSLSTTCHK